MSDLSTALNDQITASRDADSALQTSLQGNIDGVADACDAKLAAMEEKLATEVAAREADVTELKVNYQSLQILFKH